MVRWRRYLRRSIKRQFTAMMMFCLLLILIGAILVLWSTIKLLTNFQTDTDQLNKKQELVSQIARHTNGTILRVRGYYILLTQSEYDKAYEEKKALDQALTSYQKLPLTKEETKFTADVRTFFTSYFNKLPMLSKYAEANDYDAIRNETDPEDNSPLNNLIAQANKANIDMHEAVDQRRNELLRALFYQSVNFILYVILVIIIALFITRRVGKEIGTPLSNLAKAAHQFARGHEVNFEFHNRDDEIGLLSRSLDTMMSNIMANEEELVAQNEELQAQQDELQAQQEELTDALRQMEENEKYLEKQNQLIQSLANTLDKKELLQSIILHTAELTSSDKGLVILLNASKDYAAYGISDEAARQFVENLDQSLVVRVLQSREPYSVYRECTVSERAYHTEPMQATDMYIPVVLDNDGVAACLILTKIGRMASKADETEAFALAKQISLALGKLEIYEEAESSRKLNFDMLNTIQEGVQLMDLQGKTLHVNSKWLEILNIKESIKGTIGMSLEQFTNLLRDRVVEPETLILFINRIYSGGIPDSFSMNYEILTSSRHYIQIYCEPLFRNGELFGYLLVHRDITKEFEVDRMKSEFVSTVSHELRTPLASVLGFAELLLHRELSPERQHKYVSTIYQEAGRLTTLINDFLDLQRMESGKQTYEMNPIELAPLITNIIEMQQVNASNHTFEWNGDSSNTIIYGDRDKMLQVFTNLLNNAVKYSPSGGAIKVMCRNEENQLIIEIHDEGLGIPPDALPKLFSKFYRVDNTDRREIGGTGLGLAIVKEIINRHGGDVKVTSELGKGSTFTIVLPLYESQE